MIRESRGSMGKRLWKLSQTYLTLLSSRDTTGAWVQQNAIKNLKNGLFEVKFDGESAELWCSKAQGESFFQTRCDFGSFRDLFLGAVIFCVTLLNILILLLRRLIFREPGQRWWIIQQASTSGWRMIFLFRTTKKSLNRRDHNISNERSRF